MHLFIKTILVASTLSTLTLPSYGQHVELDLTQPIDLNFSHGAPSPLNDRAHFLDIDDEECYRTRGFLEIGSSNLKFTVGRVDICQEETMPPQVFFTDKRALNLKARELPDGSMPEEAIHLLIATLKDMRLKAILEISENMEWAVVATASLRGLTNQEAVIARVKELFGVDIDVMDQAEEAMFSWLSAEQLAKEKVNAVFDSGGGSFQILIRTHKEHTTEESLPGTGDYLEIFGNIGTTALKKFLRNLKGKEDFLPLIEKGRGEEDAQTLFLKEACNYIVNSISHSKKGEAGVHNRYIHELTQGHKLFGVSRSFVFSVLPLMVAALSYDMRTNSALFLNGGERLVYPPQGMDFTLKQLHRALTILAPMSSEEIRAIAPSAKEDPWGDFSNMVLVYAVLQYLNMQDVRVLEVTSSLQGALAGLQSKWITGREMHDIIWKKNSSDVPK